MTYHLYGSLTSPAVRRIRMVLENLPHEFRELNIYEPEGAKLLAQLNPVNQIPVLVDGDQVIWDSRQIFNYLNHRHRFQNMDWNDENMLTGMDGLITSGTALLLMKRSGINIEEPIMYVQRQYERIQSILTYLKPFIHSEALTSWNFHSMTLYSFLDWATFREIIKIDDYPEYKDFLRMHAAREIARKTAPPKG